MGVIVEQTARAFDRLDDAIRHFETYRDTMYRADADRLRDAGMRLLQLAAQPARETEETDA